MDDIRHNLSLLSEHVPWINLSQSLPGRISEGEAIIHPRFFDILDLIREMKGNDVEIVISTNGSTLTEDMVQRLSKYAPFTIKTLSLNSANSKHWQSLHRRGDDAAKRAIYAPQLLDHYKLPYWASIVCMPKLTGWNDIESTIAYLLPYNPQGIALFYYGWSDQTPEEWGKLQHYPIEELFEFAASLRKKYCIQLSVSPDPHADLDLPKGVMTILNKTMHYQRKNVLWLSSMLCYQFIAQKITQYSQHTWNNHWVVGTKSHTYGGNTCVCGLLTVTDYMHVARQFIAQQPDVDLILLPSISFDTQGYDLLHQHYSDIQDALGVQVVIESFSG